MEEKKTEGTGYPG